MYMMDINFIFEQSKFLSGMLQYLEIWFRALSIQITLELPSMTVLTKCDLVKDQEKIDKYLNYFSIDNYEESKHSGGSLYEQIRKIYDNNDIVSLKPLNLK